MIDHIEIDNIQMPYCHFGNGKKTLVLLPGISLDLVTPFETAIKNQYSLLLNDYTIYLFDRRLNLPKTYSIEEMAEDTAKVLKSIGLKDITLLGFSQGGMMAQSIVIHHPELVSALVLGSTSSRLNEVSKKVFKEWVKYAEEKDTESLGKAMIHEIYSQNYCEKYEQALMFTYKHLTKEKLERFLILAKPLLDFDCYEELSSIKCNTFVIGCLGDKTLTGEASVEIAEKISCPYYLYDTQYSHAVYDEAPDYVERLKQYLDSLS